MAERLKFEELKLKHNWMFTRIFSEEIVLRPFLEALLEEEIGRIERIDTEYTFDNNYNKHGVRVDVYAVDSDECIYNVEMQTTEEKGLLQRVRYYQSQIDGELLQRKDKYSSLPKSVIIFVCDFDPFGYGVAKYVKRTYIDPPMAEYDDGSRVFFLNAKYTNGNAKEDIQCFLSSLDDVPSDCIGGTKLTEAIQTIYSQIANSSKERSTYMEYWDECMRETVEKAAAEAAAKAAAKAAAEADAKATERAIVAIMEHFGVTREKALVALGISPSGSLSKMNLQGN